MITMETYTISPELETELQNKARILAVEEADKRTFEFPECRNAFIDGFIKGFVKGYFEETKKMVQALRDIGINEDVIAEVVKRAQGNVSVENKIQQKQ